jgi:hypothetical protein
MGLLDDAIREHLDLKRRHGADPAEVERAEREALGPVRRKGEVATASYPDDADEADGAFDAEADEDSGASSPVAYDQAEEDEWRYRDDEFAVDDTRPEPDSTRRSRRSSAQDDAEDQPRGLAARFGLRGRRTEEHDEDPEPEFDDEPPLSEDEATRVHRSGGTRPSSTPPPVEGETAEHDVPGVHHDEDAADEDMLEETPEFLQDTPDHDRLWFEQRPPRDFDFDA